MFRYNKSLILAKIESAYGTDPIPAPATEAIVVTGDPKFSIIGNAKVRNVPLPFFGTLAPINVGVGLKLVFATELKGSGIAGTDSRYDPLFRACNMTPLVTPGTSVSYTPHSNLDGESCTLYFYLDGSLHKVMGCVGTFKATLKANDIMQIDWDFTGLYAGNHASDVAFPTPTHETVMPIVWQGASFQYDAISTLVIEQLMFDIGNTISSRPDANSAIGISKYYISKRASKGSMNPEKVALTTLNPWTIYDQATQANLQCQPGSTAGNIVELAATGVTLEPPAYENRNDIAAWGLNFTLNPTLGAGNDELVITFK